MIPNELIDKAAQAIITSASPGITLAEMHPEDLANVRLDARVALEAVAAELYDEGYEYGRVDGDCMSYTLFEERPYRASETK